MKSSYPILEYRMYPSGLFGIELAMEDNTNAYPLSESCAKNLRRYSTARVHRRLSNLQVQRPHGVIRGERISDRFHSRGSEAVLPQVEFR